MDVRVGVAVCNIATGCRHTASAAFEKASVSVAQFLLQQNKAACDAWSVPLDGPPVMKNGWSLEG
jgi:hypothetical protein